MKLAQKKLRTAFAWRKVMQISTRFLFKAVPIMCGFLLVASTTFATDCSESFAAAELADHYEDHILTTMKSFGVNIDSTVERCTYYGHERIWNMRVYISWTGPITGDPYAARGELTVTPGGWRWKPIWANSNLFRWWFIHGLLNELTKEPSMSKGKY